MKILVVGAAGKTGRRVVDRALAAGYGVVAFVHSPKEDEKHPFAAGVNVVHGDVQNPSRLEHAMEGCEAVIDCLGGKTPFTKTDLEVSAAKVVLEVMHRVGAKRLVVISALGAGDSRDQASWMYEHVLMPTFLHGAIPNKDAMEVEVMKSEVAWTLVRPPMLSDAEATGAVHVVESGETAHKLTRGDLAQFLVDQVGSTAFVGRAVTVANQ